VTTTRVKVPVFGQQYSRRGSAALAVLAVAIGVALLLGALQLRSVVGQPTASLTGTIEVISGDNSKACITPDGGGEQRCSRLYTSGSTDVKVGDHVTVVVVPLDASGGGTTEGYLLP